MDEKKTKENSGLINTQAYIYLGYIFLLFLGIANDAIFYKYLDVNIIAYSNLLDVLLSPLTHIIERPVILGVMLVLPIVGYLYALWLHKITNKKNPNPKPFKLNTVFVVFVAFLNFCAFIGLGMGRGRRMLAKVENKTLEANHIIEFRGVGEKEVTLVGSNSTYIFYFEKGDSTMSISPIQDNVVKMEKLSE